MSSTPIHAYIYVRWSKAEQSDGDSERRQMAQIEGWCREKQWVTHPSRVYVDRGESGYSGQHLARGKLGDLFHEVQTGRVPRGSVLVIEAYDRISRLPGREGRKLIDAIVDAGIKVAVANSREVLDPENEDDFLNDVGMTMRVSLAHLESKLKRDRSRANWERKRQEAAASKAVATRGGPRWLTYKDGRWQLNGHATTVRRAFDLCLAGYGATTIASRFNKDEVPVLSRPGMKIGAGGVGSQWTSSAVLTILRSPAAYGAWQPRTATRRMENKDGVFRVTTDKKAEGGIIKGYYEAVVTEDEWLRAKAEIDGRIKSGGNRGRVTNVLAGLVRCAECKGRLQLSAQRDHKHDCLYCRDAQYGKCSSRGTIRLALVDGPILARATEAFDVIRSGRDPERDRLDAEVRVLESERDNRQAGLDLVMASAPEDQETFGAQFRRMAGLIAELDGRVAGIRARLAELDAQKPDDPGMEALIEAYHGPRGDQRDSAIRLLNSALRRVIEKITIVIKKEDTEFGEGAAPGTWVMATVGGWATTHSSWKEWELRDDIVDVAEKVANGDAMPQGLRNQMREAIELLDEMPQAGREIGARVKSRQKSPGTKPRA